MDLRADASPLRGGSRRVLHRNRRRMSGAGVEVDLVPVLDRGPGVQPLTTAVLGPGPSFGSPVLLHPSHLPIPNRQLGGSFGCGRPGSDSSVISSMACRPTSRLAMSA